MPTPTMAAKLSRPQARAGEAARSGLLENEEVQVSETMYAPGESLARHTHRMPGVVYVIEGGVLEITGADGTVEMRELHPGEAAWRPAESHATRNVGATTIRILEVEVKQADPAAGTRQTAAGDPPRAGR